MPGALLVEHYGHRKDIVLFFGGGLARLTLLVFAFLPVLIGGQALIWVAIALSVVRDAFSNLSFPAWMSITGEIIPLEGRGRYFGSRNFIMGIAGMLSIFMVGTLITRVGQPHGYQLALGLAFILGLCSTYSFSHLEDSKGATKIPLGDRFSLRAALNDMKVHPIFLALSLVMLVWNFSINIAGPFFNVFMVQNLNFTATMVGVASIISTIAGLLVQHRVGKLSDRWGPRKVQLVSMLIIPIMPTAWIFVTKFWHVIVINTFSGVVWGVFNLVSFNFLLSIIPDAQRARYAAIYQIMITLALAGGAAIGAWVVTSWGYQGVFLCSAIGRGIAALLFLRFVPNIKTCDAKN
jgi:MFS family permease